MQAIQKGITMQQLSLGGFLDKYIRELSGFERINLTKMARLADSTAPRLKEPLVVYASLKRPAAAVRKMFAGTSLLQDYETYFSNTTEQSEIFFNQLPQNYQKLYHSYLTIKEERTTEKQLKSLYRKKILMLKENHRISDYSICKAFNINHGNFHAFLYQEKIENICLEKIRKVYNLLYENQ